MKTTDINLKKKIMRRVYIAYVVLWVSSPVAIRLGLLAAAFYLFTKLVHIAAVMHSFIDIRIGDIGTYVWSVVRHADLPTLVVGTFILLIFISFRLPSLRFKRSYAV